MKILCVSHLIETRAFNARFYRRHDMVIPYHALFHFLLYSPIFAQAPESNEARLVQRLIDALAVYDYRTEVVPTLTGATVAAKSDMAIGCFLLAIDGPALPEVGGALVSGASLKAADFESIFSAVPANT